MNVLDWFLVVLVVAYAVSGYWQGFIAGAFATGGLLLGGLLGVWLAPRLLGDADPALWVSLAALFVVLVCASFGQAILQYVGAKIRSRIKWQPVRALDAVGGAALSMAAVLVVAWALGVAISGAKLPWASREVRGSAVLERVNGVMPPDAVQALNSFNDVVGSSFFPRYLEPFAPERIVNVGPPPGRVARDPDVRRAAAERLQDPRRELLQPGRRGQRVPLRPGPRDDQRPRGGRRRQARRARRRATSGRRRSSTTTPTSTSRCSPSTGPRAAPALRPARPAAARPAAVLGYPQDGPYNVQAGPDPRRAAAAQPRHLRRRHRRARGVLAARPGAARQLRRPAGLLGRQGARRDLRGVGDRHRHRLRADRGPGRRGRRERADPRRPRATPARCA